MDNEQFNNPVVLCYLKKCNTQSFQRTALLVSNNW